MDRRAVGRLARGGLGRRTMRDLQRVARKKGRRERISGLALGHRKTPRRRPTEGLQAAGLR